MNDPDEQVRRLLASARSQEPLPPEVVSRLDDVLAGLVAERAAVTTEQLGPRNNEGASVSVLPQRRRQAGRWALAAAAAIVVGGVAMGQLMGSGPDDSASMSQAGSSADVFRSESPAPDGESDLTRDRLAPQEEGDGTSGGGSPGASTLTSLPVVGSDTFAADVAAVALSVAAQDSLAPPTGLVPRSGSGSGSACTPAVVRASDGVVEVLYDGEPAVLVLRTVSADRLRALLFGCGASQASRSAVVPAP